MKEALSLAVESMEPLEFILPATGDKVKWKLQVGTILYEIPELGGYIQI
jgi:hypothetical protein